MKVAILMTLIVALGSTAATAYSNDSSKNNTVQRTVDFKDLDLSTEHGRTVLKRRIVRAAEDVCGMSETFELWTSPSFRHCVTQSTETALAKLNKVDM